MRPPAIFVRTNAQLGQRLSQEYGEMRYSGSVPMARSDIAQVVKGVGTAWFL